MPIFIVSLTMVCVILIATYYFVVTVIHIDGDIKTKREFWIAAIPFGLVALRIYEKYKELE